MERLDTHRYAHPSARSGSAQPQFFDLAIPDHAYLFGLLQTDGSHYAGTRNRGRITIELAVRDAALLYRLVDLCPWYSSVHNRKRTTNFSSNYETAVWTLCSWDARRELAVLGLPSGRKTARIVPPSIDLATRDYVRGLIDGDGSIGFTSTDRPFVGFTTASESVARYFEAYAESIANACRKTNRNRRDGVFNLMYQVEAAATLAGHLYRDDDLALLRKAETAQRVSMWVRPSSMGTARVRRSWTPEEDELARSKLSTVEVAQVLNRTAESVKLRRWRLSRGEKR